MVPFTPGKLQARTLLEKVNAKRDIQLRDDKRVQKTEDV